jgi:FKBP-type peptidyl-prolyl cis-trans isomerase FkpA
MKRLLRSGAFVPLLLVAVAGCASSPVGVDLRQVSFAPELGIDLDRMTRTSSGLYYEDVATGNAPTAMRGRWVSVLYRGWLADGTLFDQSVDARDPLEFRLGAGTVIKGWDEGLAGVRLGGIRKLVIPPSLGYGHRPTGPIPANSVLVFEIQVVGVR